jgi:hypothetical protein
VSDATVRNLLIAILAVSAANLVVSMVQTTIALTRPAPPGSIDAAGNAELPSKFSPDELQRLAARVTEPYNRNDLDAVYAEFDELTKVQVSREKFREQMGSVSEVVGRVDSFAFAGWQKIPNQGGLPQYQLNYLVRLSGGRFSGGAMSINVVDRGESVGVIGFFINGATQR